MKKLNDIYPNEPGLKTAGGYPVPGRFGRRTLTFLRGATWNKFYQRTQALAVGLSQLLPTWDIFFVSDGEMNVIRPQARNLFVVSPLWFEQFKADLARGVFFTTWPRLADELLTADTSWFDLCDHPSLFYPKGMGEREQSELGRALTADIFTSTLNRMGVEHRLDGWTIPNGCWPANTALNPLTVQSAPVIGFWGSMGPWVDADLLNELGKRYAVLVACEPGKCPPTCADMGYLRYDQLKWFAKLCTHLIIPFKRGPIAEYSDPIKQYEYAAANRVSLIPTWIPNFHGLGLTNYRRYTTLDELVNVIGEYRVEDLKRFDDPFFISWETRCRTLVAEVFGRE